MTGEIVIVVLGMIAQLLVPERERLPLRDPQPSRGQAQTLVIGVATIVERVKAARVESVEAERVTGFELERFARPDRAARPKGVAALEVVALEPIAAELLRDLREARRLGDAEARAGPELRCERGRVVLIRERVACRDRLREETADSGLEALAVE